MSLIDKFIAWLNGEDVDGEFYVSDHSVDYGDSSIVMEKETMYVKREIKNEDTESEE